MEKRWRNKSLIIKSRLGFYADACVGAGGWSVPSVQTWTLYREEDDTHFGWFKAVTAATCAPPIEDRPIDTTNSVISLLCCYTFFLSFFSLLNMWFSCRLLDAFQFHSHFQTEFPHLLVPCSYLSESPTSAANSTELFKTPTLSVFHLHYHSFLCNNKP